MRGKLNLKIPITSSNRITPADAGKTRQDPKINPFSEDHPRGCGENLYRNIIRNI